MTISHIMPVVSSAVSAVDHHLFFHSFHFQIRETAQQAISLRDRPQQARVCEASENAQEYELERVI